MKVENILSSNVDWENVSGGRKYFTVVWAVLECFLLAGIFYGWYSLVFVLNEDGIYGELCVIYNASTNHTLDSRNDGLQNLGMIAKNGDRVVEYHDSLNLTFVQTLAYDTAHPGHMEPTHDCSKRNERMGLVFAIAALGMTVGCVVMGYVQDTFGVRVTRLIVMVIYSMGTLCIAFVTTALPWLTFIGMLFLGFASLPLLMGNMQVANLFSAGAAMVIGLMSGSFDASASVQVIVKLLHQNGISRMISYIFLTCLCIVMVTTSTFVLMPKMHIPKRKLRDVPIPDAAEIEQASLVQSAVNIPSFRDCFWSRFYLLHVLWLSILQLRFFFYIASFNAWLHYIAHGDHETVSHFTNVSMFTQYGGIVAAPLIGFILDLERKRHKHKPLSIDRTMRPAVIPLLVTSSIGVVMSSLILVPHPVILYIVFVLLTLFRAFLYGMGAAYVQIIFPTRYFGRLFGLMTFMAGLFGLLQYAFIVWLDLPPVGPFKVNVCLLLVTLLSYIHPLVIWLTCRCANVRAPPTDNLQPMSLNTERLDSNTL